MTQRWGTEQVLALAPDRASVAAARQLAAPATWSGAGATTELLWGSCRGSGQDPYRTAVDLADPAFHCSCPSRKFPCKHAVALLLLWSAGEVPDIEEPADFAREWHSQRAARGRRTTPASGLRDEAAAAKRAAQRSDRVAAGLAELELWLRDQVRAGITGASVGYQHVEPVAARMVDAQAPGVAAALRGLGGISGTGHGWPARLLAGYARLHLLARAHEQLADQPPDLAATIRTHVGYPTPKETVLAGDAVRDTWTVLGRRDLLDGAVPARRTWLRGERSGQYALLLAFDPRGSFAADEGAVLTPGSAVAADLHFYAGRPPLRALLGERRDTVATAPPPTPSSIATLLDDWALVLERDPWLTRWPGVLAGVPVAGADGWLLAEDERSTVPLDLGGADPWTLVAISGGEPVVVAGEWTGVALRPLTVWDDDRAVAL